MGDKRQPVPEDEWEYAQGKHLPLYKKRNPCEDKFARTAGSG
jgi:hypothetical protein